MRELKEETGIKLDRDEVKNSPWLDLLQTDNFNPHKGTCSDKMVNSSFCLLFIRSLASNPKQQQQQQQPLFTLFWQEKRKEEKEQNNIENKVSIELIYCT